MLRISTKGMKAIKCRKGTIVLEYNTNKAAFKAYIDEFGRVMNVANKYREIGMKQVGTISTYFAKVNVAAIKLTKPMKVGDKIKIIGATTDVEKEVTSMEIDNKEVKDAKIGDDVGIKVNDRVRKGDKVFIV